MATIKLNKLALKKNMNGSEMDFNVDFIFISQNLFLVSHLRQILENEGQSSLKGNVQNSYYKLVWSL